MDKYDKYVTWLKHWFAYRSGRVDLPIECENKNYFELGLIDSFGVIELIDAIENQFEIKFNQDNFQDRRFSTITGLATIIVEIRQS